MSDEQFDTPALRDYVDRWQSGDKAAADELLRRAGKRLENLARNMCRHFPNVQGWAETSDVLQGSVMRLLRTLESIQPSTTRDFFNLAAVHIRRELLDLARHCRSRICLSLETKDPQSDDIKIPHLQDPISRIEGDLDLWTRFHQAVEELPPLEREIVGLAFYHGWSQERIAALLNMNVRTVRRRWSDSVNLLKAKFGQVFASQ